jgi:hypothetical protein
MFTRFQAIPIAELAAVAGDLERAIDTVEQALTLDPDPGHSLAVNAGHHRRARASRLSSHGPGQGRGGVRGPDPL